MMSQPTKTYDQLGVASGLLSTDLVAIQRGAGTPLLQTTVQGFINWLLANGAIQPPWTKPQNWSTGTAYNGVLPSLSCAVYSGNTYVCLTSHTAGTFATDLAAGKWLLVATGVGGASYLVPCTVISPNANILNLTPYSGWPVSATDQIVVGTAVATNNGNVTAACPGITATDQPVLMPDGTQVPPGTIKNTFGFMMRWRSSASVWELIHPYYYPQPMRIFCNVVSWGVTTTIQMAFPTKIPTSGAGVELAYRASANQVTGGQALSVLDFYGNQLFGGAIPFRDTDGVSQIPANTIQQNDLVTVMRDATSGIIYRTLPTNAVTPVVSLQRTYLAEPGFLPSVPRPVLVNRVSKNLYVADIYLNPSHYRDGIQRVQSDIVRVVICNMGDFEGITSAWAINSICCRIQGRWSELSNFMFDRVIGGIIVNNGLVPSTFENVISLGIYGSAVNSTNYALAGYGHNDEIDNGAITAIGTQNDASTAYANVNSSDLSQLPIGATFFEGMSLTLTQNFYYQCPNGSGGLANAAAVTMLTTLESVAAHQVRVQVTANTADPGVTITPGFNYGYNSMLPCRDVDTIAITSNGVPQASVPAGQGDGSTTTLGVAEKVTVWSSLNPWAKLEMYNALGPGVAYQKTVGGVTTSVAQTDAMLAINNQYGTKVYSPFGGSSSDADSIANMSLYWDTRYRLVCAKNVT